jgi:hypothetical protein
VVEGPDVAPFVAAGSRLLPRSAMSEYAPTPTAASSTMADNSVLTQRRLVEADDPQPQVAPAPLESPAGSAPPEQQGAGVARVVVFVGSIRFSLLGFPVHQRLPGCPSGSLEELLEQVQCLFTDPALDLLTAPLDAD